MVGHVSATGGARFRYAAALALASAAACAGSSSESPWPVEPVQGELDPRGEKVKAGIEVKDLPNRYGQGGAGGGP